MLQLNKLSLLYPWLASAQQTGWLVCFQKGQRTPHSFFSKLKFIVPRIKLDLNITIKTKPKYLGLIFPWSLTCYHKNNRTTVHRKLSNVCPTYSCWCKQPPGCNLQRIPKEKNPACSSVMHSTTVQILTEVYRQCHNPSDHEF